LFSWDEAKNASNRKKHRVSFEAAMLVFDDPLHLSRLDLVERGEERWQTIGMAGNVLLLLVVHTLKEFGPDEPHIHIISARRATRQEREIYEEGA
jgi:uncharacterized protein